LSFSIIQLFNNFINRFEHNPNVVEISFPEIGKFYIEVHAKTDLYISKAIQTDKVWEPFETELLVKTCEVGDIVMDIGANIGWYSLIAAIKTGAKGKVFSFEPDHDNYNLLVKNIRRLSLRHRVQPFNIALGARQQHGNLFLNDNNMGDHRIFPSSDTNGVASVEIDTIDNITAKYNLYPDIIKIDTQGAESAIFNGATQSFANGKKPVWFVEFWPYGIRLSGYDPLGLWEKFISMGYTIFEIRPDQQKLYLTSEEYIMHRLATDMKEGKGEIYCDLLLIDKSSNKWNLIEPYLSTQI
jgi:methyltransferase, FkbM family